MNQKFPYRRAAWRRGISTHLLGDEVRAALDQVVAQDLAPVGAVAAGGAGVGLGAGYPAALATNLNQNTIYVARCQ